MQIERDGQQQERINKICECSMDTFGIQVFDRQGLERMPVVQLNQLFNDIKGRSEKGNKKALPKKSVEQQLSAKEVENILHAAAAISTRDYLILWLIAKAGAKIGELYGVYDKEQRVWIRGLQKKDIDFTQKTLCVYQIQRKKTLKRKILVDDVVIMNALKEQIKAMNHNDFVFRNDSLTYDIIVQLPRKYGRHVEIEKKISVQSLRQFFIADLLRKGVDIPTIQYRAGHRDIKNTLSYV